MPSISGSFASGAGGWVSKLVRVYRQDTGAFVGQALCTPESLAWSVPTFDYAPHFAIAHDTGTGDFFWAYTKVALPMDGINGATQFTELFGANVQRVGTGITITTDKGVTSGSSCSFPGTASNYLVIPARGLYIGTGDFTIEMHVNKTAGSSQAYQRLLQLGPNGANGGLWIAANRATGNEFKPFLDTYSSGYFSPVMANNWGTALTQGEFHHLELSRSGNTFRMFLDGVERGNGTLNNYNIIQNDIYIGANNTGGESFAGCIDRLRIVVGKCLHETNFTPPTSSFVAGLTSGSLNAQIFDNLTPV